MENPEIIYKIINCKNKIQFLQGNRCFIGKKKAVEIGTKYREMVLKKTTQNFLFQNNNNINIGEDSSDEDYVD